MRRMRQLIWRFLKRDDGPTAVEYAVVIAGILLVCIGAVNSVGRAVSESLQNTAELIGTASDGGGSGGGDGGSGSGGSGNSGSGDSGGSGSGSGGGGGKGKGKGK